LYIRNISTAELLGVTQEPGASDEQTGVTEAPGLYQDYGR